jgi:hypothetical protein
MLLTATVGDVHVFKNFAVIFIPEIDDCWVNWSDSDSHHEIVSYKWSNSVFFVSFDQTINTHVGLILVLFIESFHRILDNRNERNPDTFFDISLRIKTIQIAEKSLLTHFFLLLAQLDTLRQNFIITADTVEQDYSA